METASGGVSSSAESKRLIECPVCFEIFLVPKSLSCGHSICDDCERKLIQQDRHQDNNYEGIMRLDWRHGGRFGPQITCPQCRIRTPVPHNGLPVNYSLSDLVSQITREEREKAERASTAQRCCICDKTNDAEQTWLCLECNRMLLCCQCALKNHKNHALQELQDIINSRKKALSEWAERKQTIELRQMQQDFQRHSSQFGTLSNLLSECMIVIGDLKNGLKGRRDQLQARVGTLESDIVKFAETGVWDQNEGGEEILTEDSINFCDPERAIKDLSKYQENASESQKAMLKYFTNEVVKFRKFLNELQTEESSPPSSPCKTMATLAGDERGLGADPSDPRLRSSRARLGTSTVYSSFEDIRISDDDDNEGGAQAANGRGREIPSPHVNWAPPQSFGVHSPGIRAGTEESNNASRNSSAPISPEQIHILDDTLNSDAPPTADHDWRLLSMDSPSIVQIESPIRVQGREPSRSPSPAYSPTSPVAVTRSFSPISSITMTTAGREARGFRPGANRRWDWQDVSEYIATTNRGGDGVSTNRNNDANNMSLVTISDDDQPPRPPARSGVEASTTAATTTATTTFLYSTREPQPIGEVAAAAGSAASRRRAHQNQGPMIYSTRPPEPVVPPNLIGSPTVDIRLTDAATTTYRPSPHRKRPRVSLGPLTGRTGRDTLSNNNHQEPMASSSSASNIRVYSPPPLVNRRRTRNGRTPHSNLIQRSNWGDGPSSDSDN